MTADAPLDRAPFLVLEGPEGAGKSTQCAQLERWLANGGHPCLLVREPGGTPVGEAIRTHLWVRPELAIPPVAELFLLSAARHTLTERVIRPSLEDGTAVVADRFALSTLAYQGFGRGLDLGTIRAVTAVATGGLEPDLTVVIDVSVEEGAVRQQRAGEDPDRIEQEDRAFMERVREGYLALAEDDDRIVVVDGSDTPERVQETLRALVRERFTEWMTRSRAP